MYPLLLLDHRQHVSGVDGYPGRDVKRYYRSGHWSFHLLLHLNSFDYDDAGSRFDLFANLDQHAHHFPGHGRDDAGAGIVVVEAMKMQNEMKSPMAGTVVTLNVSAGI